MNIPRNRALLEEMNTAGVAAGVDSSGGFAYRLDFSVPQIAVAIHAGHGVRSEVAPLMALTPEARKFEEDTGTDAMVQGYPNAVWGLESRAVYDLNRSLDMALPLTPEKFWGTRVYRKRPTPEMNTRSIESHKTFYRFFGTVITHMLDRFGYCVVYDIHSYNITRQQANGIAAPPVFNLGTAALDRTKWAAKIDMWLDCLRGISLPGIAVTVAENLVFHGNGEFCQRLTGWDPRILVLPTEVAKVYMDEITGEIYPDILNALRSGLAQAMATHME